MAGSDPISESPRDRKRLARQAGLGRLSFISVLAGVLVAYGAFALLAALVGAVAVVLDLDTELASNDWATLGRGSAVTATVVAFVAYLDLPPGGGHRGYAAVVDGSRLMVARCCSHSMGDR